MNIEEKCGIQMSTIEEKAKELYPGQYMCEAISRDKFTE